MEFLSDNFFFTFTQKPQVSTLFQGAVGGDKKYLQAYELLGLSGEKLIQPLMTGILIMRPYKPLRTWVDEFIPYYMEIMGV